MSSIVYTSPNILVASMTIIHTITYIYNQVIPTPARLAEARAMYSESTSGMDIESTSKSPKCESESILHTTLTCAQNLHTEANNTIHTLTNTIQAFALQARPIYDPQTILEQITPNSKAISLLTKSNNPTLIKPAALAKKVSHPEPKTVIACNHPGHIIINLGSPIPIKEWEDTSYYTLYINEALENSGALANYRVQTIICSNSGNLVIYLHNRFTVDQMIHKMVWLESIVHVISNNCFSALGDHTWFYTKLCGVPTRHPKSRAPMSLEEVLDLLFKSHPNLSTLDWMDNPAWMATDNNLLHKTMVSIVFPFGNKRDKTTFLKGGKYFVSGQQTYTLKYNKHTPIVQCPKCGSYKHKTCCLGVFI